jgi:hypothetical protein
MSKRFLSTEQDCAQEDSISRNSSLIEFLDQDDTSLRSVPLSGIRAILTRYNALDIVFICLPRTILLFVPVTVLIGEYYLDLKVFI